MRNTLGAALGGALLLLGASSEGSPILDSNKSDFRNEATFADLGSIVNSTASAPLSHQFFLGSPWRGDSSFGIRHRHPRFRGRRRSPHVPEVPPPTEVPPPPEVIPGDGLEDDPPVSTELPVPDPGSAPVLDDEWHNDDVGRSSIPEPGTLVLVGSGLLALALRRPRR